MPRPVGGSEKLGTFAGVFVPTSLNVLSILMFIRFGFILGQSGFLGMMGMLIACYLINLLTTMSISAIATNGTVRGGGAYYLISRSLGPEFGGSIGVVFYLGFVFNTGMNAVGLIDCLRGNFGVQGGNWSNWLPESFWWNYLWGTVVLVLCTAICLAGSGLFARASNALLAILLIATFSIPFSALILQPFEDRRLGIQYTGLSLDTFMGNLYPMFTRGADGSQLKGRENWQDLFGILFPATGGIFAGASMSGDLKHPSKAIPKGTLYGLALTFISYTLVILALASTITRATFYRNVNVIQDVNISGVIILLGECSSTLFSTLMGVIGSAKLLQALARDNLVPGLSIFSQGTKKNDEPTYAIIITYLVTQFTMLSDINQIASFVAMTYLMTFLVMNLACFLLKISSAPNFRPSFRYFNWATAATGAILSGASMFFVDGAYASGCVLILAILFLIIHYSTPPKSWGDVSQSLIYHQVRKYLLRLKQEHVKFWRPQILLLVNDPRRQYKLIQFCNSLKKGALFILGHVIVNENFGDAVPEAKRQQHAWGKYIDFSKIKAFVNIVISPAVEWGTRNLVLSAGLGGMRPNIVVMGFYNMEDRRKSEQDQLVDVASASTTAPTTPVVRPYRGEDHMEQSRISTGFGSTRAISRGSSNRKRYEKANKPPGHLPTDSNRSEHPVTAASYVTILEDLLIRVQINVALAKGFQNMELPMPKPTKMERLSKMLRFGSSHGEDEEGKKYIDLWPIQMSAEIAAEGSANGGRKRHVLTTNFDTYTLILQLGCILNTVPSWKRTYKLRVVVFVEYEADVEEERVRVKTLLNNLRIKADILVFWLACGELRTYEIIVNGKKAGLEDATKEVDEALKDEDWWQEVKALRRRGTSQASAMRDMAEVAGLLDSSTNWPGSSFQHGRREQKVKRFEGLRKMLKKTKRRRTSVGGISEMGVSLGMRTHRLDPDLIDRHSSQASASEGSSSSSSETGESDSDDAPDLDDQQEMESETLESDDITASENDVSVDEDDPPVTPIRRAVSMSANLGRSKNLVKSKSGTRTPTTSEGGQKPRSFNQPEADISDTELMREDPGDNAAQQTVKPIRPPNVRQQSLPKFTSKPVPKTKVAKHEGPGPSIMFADSQPSPDEHGEGSVSQKQRIQPQQHGEQARSSDSVETAVAQDQAQGHLSAPAVPLSFNDLPCRAQHLILNELMRAVSSPSPSPSPSPANTPPASTTETSSPPPGHSQFTAYASMLSSALGSDGTDLKGNGNGTAVLFTTLPSPVSGTGESETDSLRYLMDLEVLCKGLPPVLLVHSNSISVTMSL
ncbi:hypothetical protein NA57DRAFT_66175 [Rhizodiscina lignyota]|uniref:Cation chloride cotransporter n=1 Tax=Rhizodiscina lignyota TaxID=1504668 RepID=A0A9P4IFA3_9PEZI|nr:hypothetical protein NA57DRAFT_66175 [Rhizodiscina lignyota]